MNNLAPMKNCPGGVQGNLNWMPGYYRYRKLRNEFSKFYHKHTELSVKCNNGLKTLLQHSISESIFYGDLVYKFKRIVESLPLVMNF